MDPKPSQYVKTITVEGGIKPIGPYTVGKIVDARANILYLSGNIGLDPKTQALISEDVGEQARQTLVNIGQVLEAGNSSYANIIKSTVYLVDMNDFAKVNEEYARFFKSDFPARSCFAVKQLPKNALVEIEVIAVQNDPATAPQE